MRPLATLLALSMLAIPAAPASAQLIPADVELEKVADGYRFTEGPAAGPDGCIYFTDIPAQLILKYDPQTGETETFIENNGQANGLMFRGERMFYCAHRSRVLGVYEEERFVPTAPDGHLHDNLYAMCTQYEGKLLNSPNDLDIDRHGQIYFTDPRYGNRDSMELEVEGVYFFDPRKLIDIHLFPEGEEPKGFVDPVRIISDLTRPNGIVLSPDESILYVADNGTNEIFAYDVEAPGEIENKRLFARLNDGEGGGADGMCVDALGRLYASGQGKIWIYNPDGSAAGVIDVGPQCTNCTFAADGKTLYITANHGLYRIELNTDEAVPEQGNELGILLPRLDLPNQRAIPEDAVELQIRLVNSDIDAEDIAAILGRDGDGPIELWLEGEVVEEDGLLDAISSLANAEGETFLVIRVDPMLQYRRVADIVTRIGESDLDVVVDIAALKQSDMQSDDE